MAIVFPDRREAGRILAGRLGHFAGRADVVVLALPRGGVPVAYEVAQALKAPLDVFVVRKLGVPGYEELAMGAIASSGVRVLNDEIVEDLSIPAHVIDAVTAKEERELARRERLYRGGRAPLALNGRTVILVDDGLATGSTMRVAVRALREKRPARIVVAVPVGSPDVCEAMTTEADEVICATTPQPLFGVGRWYEDFSQTRDDEVRSLLAKAGQPPAQAEDPPEDMAGFLRKRIIRLSGGARDYDPLLGAIGDARFVLLGEASHGTHEFYEERARITQRLIEDKGFAAVALEADWPDAYRVNRYVQGTSEDIDAEEALADFRRFPAWMWRNRVVVDFVEWLRRYNDARAEDRSKVGFYGLDLYALHAAMKAVLRYLMQVDPAAAEAARQRYACFDHFGPDPQTYGLIAGKEVEKSCQDAVIAQLVEMLKRRPMVAAPRAGPVEDELFAAQQNARLVKNAEAYYRAMFLAPELTWNLRDRHMAEIFEALATHLGQRMPSPKIVVWAHNSHLGDARATDRSQFGEINLGQLIRETHEDAFLVGFTTYRGTVTAASYWDGPAERKTVSPALPRSYEALLHAVSSDRFYLDLRNNGDVLPQRLLERAIGVIYRPETERASHYFHADLAAQFDALLHFDETRAVEPLERTSEWDAGELPETYPFGV